MAVTNTGDGDMPAGLGHHPYFRRSKDARLRVGLGEMWEGDEAGFPLRRVPVPARFDFSAGREVDPVDLDAVFVGWTRPARIEWPSERLVLEISASAIFGRLVVFVPPGKPFFAVEPVSHDTDAFNRPGEDGGLRVLALTYGGAVETYETTHGITRKYHDAEETWRITCTHPKNAKGSQAE